MKIRHKLARTAYALLKEEKGTTILETAFVLPPLLLIIMGTIEFGVIFYIQSLMTYAGNEAARLGKTGDTYGYSSTECLANHNCREELTVKTIRERVGPWITNPNDLTISETAYGSFNSQSNNTGAVSGAGGSGQIVLYTVTLNWRILTPLIAQLAGGTVPITARVLVKNEGF